MLSSCPLVPPMQLLKTDAECDLRTEIIIHPPLEGFVFQKTRVFRQVAKRFLVIEVARKATYISGWL